MEARIERAQRESPPERGARLRGVIELELPAREPVVMPGETRADPSLPDGAHAIGIAAAPCVEDAGDLLPAAEPVSGCVRVVPAIAEDAPVDEAGRCPREETVPVLHVGVDAQRPIERADGSEHRSPHERGLE